MFCEAVVEVGAVGDVDRPAVLDPLGDDERGVDQRHREHEQRQHERRQAPRSSSRPCTETAAEREAEQERARVAHEDPRRVEVVAQEAEAGAEDDRGQDRVVDVAAARGR